MEARWEFGGSSRLGAADRLTVAEATGVSAAPSALLLLRQELRGTLDRAEIPKSPFTRATGLPQLGAHWVRPEIVVQVAFIEWTVHGKLRHSRLVGIRHDKAAREVLRETS